jgi:hypothetical protein
MTRQEAEAKAKELWPERGHVFDRVDDGSGVDWGDILRYWVGDADDDPVEWWSGNGATWEEAFANVRKITFREEFNA